MTACSSTSRRRASATSAPCPGPSTTTPPFYDGNPHGPGHAVNPATAEPYEPQVVPLGDYTRVLAEFWADGPDSETPPGHWFVILNAVSDHPALVRAAGRRGASARPAGMGT